jgi:hypothetical protein
MLLYLFTPTGTQDATNRAVNWWEPFDDFPLWQQSNRPGWRRETGTMVSIEQGFCAAINERYSPFKTFYEK